MPSIMHSITAAVLLLAGQAAAHMTLGYPVPYDKDEISTSPLAPDGHDYPCQVQTYDISTMNDMAVNEPIDLKFNGSVPHGGGTCQIAVTLDKKPTKDSVFKIVQVYEGGCPTADAASSPAEDKFKFTIPTGFPSGQASLAWVWYNKIGNREIYMNCAPITVTGGSESKDVFNSLPNLYVINLPQAECGTVDTSDLEIPNPGKNVIKDALATFKAPTGPSCAASAAAQTAGLSGYQTASPDSSNSTQSASSTASGVPATSAPPGYVSGAPIIPTMVTISTAAPAYSVPAVTSASADTPSSYPTLTVSSGAGIYGSGTAAGSGASSIATGSSSSGSTCPTDGAVVCNGAFQFGLCNHGKVVWQAVAAGTTCSNGSIQKRSGLRHAHVRRHAQHGRVFGQ